MLVQATKEEGRGASGALERRITSEFCAGSRKNPQSLGKKGCAATLVERMMMMMMLLMMGFWEP